MTAQELETQLLSLTPAQKVEAICILTQGINTNNHGITKTPGVMGADACIAGTRIPVWLLATYRQQGAKDADILDQYPSTLAQPTLVTAWLYAEAFPHELILLFT
ncbi:DUF433 domain-containing protein, partial [Nostoc sp. 'Peltigera malacea cyanobiont' DB3992]|uniref:DUF433 domain-containing protein n=1 Tax=Nostoc sp. 'Peltigera malacea cyanobiont' DB3992 TaxID=1206980 RepID=UPI000C045897